MCENLTHPIFPMILDVTSSENIPPLRMAVGIIDYIERSVHFLEKFKIGRAISMSTMKRPLQYKEWWMRMWPSYFHLPVRNLTMTSGLIEAADHAPAERVQMGQMVCA